MKKLITGLHSFKENVFATRRDFFTELAKGQSPGVLFITCSDSRISPNLMTQSDPGELFVIRNAGNLIPAHDPTPGGEAATIEYAVSALQVKDIVVCGHTQCGAVKALLDPPSTDELPLVKSWLRHADSTLRIVKENYADLDKADQESVAVAENVLVQLEHLRTLPPVASATRGELRLHGWVYKIETGEVFAYDCEQQQFAPLHQVPEASSGKRKLPPF